MGLHDLAAEQWTAGIGERSDAVLRTALPGDEQELRRRHHAA
jgi:hypothetical protein